MQTPLIPAVSLLADQMKRATKTLHTKAEKTGIIASILQSHISRDQYIIYLRNLYEVYKALEDNMFINKGSPTPLTIFLNPILQRTLPIEHDLAQLTGGKHWHTTPIFNSAENYVNNIEALKRDNPIALIGHIYVRYLGDINGGVILDRLLKDSLNLPPDSLSFYAYPGIRNLNDFRQNYRQLFNDLDLHETEQNVIVKTAKLAFKFNIALSKETKLCNLAALYN